MPGFLQDLLLMLDFTLLLELVIKATLVFGGAYLLTLLLRRASAFVRHWIWALAFYAFCLTAIVTLNFSTVSLDLLPAMNPEQTSTAIQAPSPMVGGEPPLEHSHPETVAELTTSDATLRLHWTEVLLIGWVAGATLLLLKFLFDHFLLFIVARFKTRSSSEYLAKTMATLKAELDVERVVRLRISHLVQVPCTFGSLRPVILLPAAAECWSEERCRMILLHELAHVSRFDYLNSQLSRLMAAVFWFHPLVWLAKYHLQVESEQACDDKVLLTGQEKIGYAQCLLGFFQELQTRRPYLDRTALSMTTPANIKPRLKAILSEGNRRASVSRWRVLLYSFAVLTLTIPIGLVSVQKDSGGLQASMLELLVRVEASEVQNKRVLEIENLARSNLTDNMPVFIQALNDPDPAVQVAAMEAVALSGDRKNFKLVMGFLNHKNPQLRAATVRALGTIGCEPAFIAIANQLDDLSPIVQFAAIRTIATFEPHLHRGNLRTLFHVQHQINKTTLLKAIPRPGSLSVMDKLRVLAKSGETQLQLLAQSTYLKLILS